MWVPASVLLVISLLLAKDGHWTTAAVFTLIGLPLAAIPPAYFFRARVTLEDRVLVKFGAFRRVGWSAPEAIFSITPYTTRWTGSRWSADDFGPLESHGYALKLADGTPIFKLSSTWWSEEGIWQLGRRLGLDGTLGASSSPGMRRRRGYVAAIPLENDGQTSPSATGKQGLQASTIGIVLIVLLVIAVVLLLPLVSGKPYP